MKPFSLSCVLVLISLPLCAQTPDAPAPDAPPSAPSTPPPAPNGGAVMDQVTSVLSPAEKNQLMSVRLKAMAANPDLQSEEMDLMQKGMSLQSGTATDADKQAFRDEIKQHADKVRSAMVKVDPTIEPVLEKVEAQVAKLRAQYQAPQ